MLRNLWESIVDVLFFWWDPFWANRSGLGMSDDWKPGDPPKRKDRRKAKPDRS